METKPARGSPRQTYVSIQYLRGIAAVMVVAWHAEGQMGVAGTRILQSGIEFFFIISGFVMWIVADEGEANPGVFIARRLARVLPLYWALTTAAVLVALIAPALLQSLRLAPAHVLASYLFIPWTNPTPGVGLRPLLIPGWTLNYEMAFYALIAASLWVPRPWRAFVLVGVLLATAILGGFVSPAHPLLAFYTSPLVTEFALGVGLAMTIRALPESAMQWGGLITVTGCALLAMGGVVIDAQASCRLILFGIPAVLIVGGAAMWEKGGQRTVSAPLRLLGDASYPLYIVHTVLLSALAQIWRRTVPARNSPLLFIMAGLVLCVGVGLLLHLSLEKPLTRALQSRLSTVLGKGRPVMAMASAAPEPP